MLQYVLSPTHQGKDSMRKLRNKIMRTTQFLSEEQIATATPDELVSSHIPLIFSTISRYRDTSFYEDLFQECVLCLINASKSFDSKKGMSFTSYVKVSLNGTVLKYMDQYCMPMKLFTTKSLKKIRYNIHRYMENDELSEEAITKMCEDLNVTPAQITEYRTRALAFGKTTSELYDSDGAGDDCIDIYDTISDMTYEPSEVLSRIQREVAFENAMKGLSDRETKILQERYMFDVEKASLMSLSNELGISQQRVSQIEKAAIKKLKKQLEIH